MMFGSVRLQAAQDEFARFCSDTQRLRAQVMAKHFDVQTLIDRSNIMQTDDGKNPQLVQQAAALIKDRLADYRIEVKPESVSLSDFSALKQEAMEVLGGLTTFLQAMGPLAQQMPASMPFLLQMLQWAMSRIRGAGSMESILDSAIEAAKQAEAAKAANPQAAPVDPKVQAETMKLQGAQMKIQGDLQKQQMKHGNDLERIQAETAAHNEQEQSQAMWNTREAAQKGMIQRALKPVEPPKPGGVPK
jgi:hypothetical protein